LAGSSGNYCYCGGGGGGGGGGNNPPSCNFDAFPNAIDYDGKAFVDPNSGTNQVLMPSSNTYAIATSDPDGDSVSITSFSVDKPDCLAATRSGKQVTLTPQGAVTGKTPTLDGPTSNVCTVTLTAQVSDGNGGTASCSKSIQVRYPRPRLSAVYLYDFNHLIVPAAPDDQPPNALRDDQFAYVGGMARDPFAPAGVPLLNAGSPTQDLPPADQRVQVQQYLASDHNMLRLALVVRDANGNKGLNLNAWAAENTTAVYLDGPTGQDIPLLIGGYGITRQRVWDPTTKVFWQVYLYGIDAGGGIVPFGSFTDFDRCVNDPNTAAGLPGMKPRINADGRG